VPQQALVLVNSRLAHRAAAALARELSSRSDGLGLADSEFVRSAFGAVLTRVPTDKECQACQEFLRQREEMARASTDQKAEPTGVEATGISPASIRAREQLVHVLLNHNDFVAVR
jgi:hypothetical protein